MGPIRLAVRRSTSRVALPLVGVALVALLMAFLRPSGASATGKAGATKLSFTAGIEGRAPLQVQEIFLRSKFPILYSGGSVIMSANEDGTGQIAVDDQIVIVVRHPDGSTSTYSHDYSNGCQGFITPTNPVDLASDFTVGRNMVTVEMMDLCGSSLGSSSYWLLP
jgi:hypothetical protein